MLCQIQISKKSQSSRASLKTNDLYNGATSQIRTGDPRITSAMLSNDLYNGATSQIRTGDPRITSAMLWPAELKWQNLVTPTGIEPMSPP